MDYANPDAIVSTDWLADNLGAPGLRVLDATYFLPTAGRDAKAEYAERHIEGAGFFDINDIADRSQTLPHMLPDAETFSAKVGALGIGNGDRVVVYDANGGAMAAARAWWTFRVFGHDNVAVLSGGLIKWLAEGRPVTDAPARPEPQPFAAAKNLSMVRDTMQLLANLKTGAEQIADARSLERFKGTAPEPRQGLRAGHIPGSNCLPFPLLQETDGSFVMLPADAIRKAIADAGLDMARPVVTSCGSGVTAAFLAFGFHLVGKDDVSVYDGSWMDWGGREDTPVET